MFEIQDAMMEAMSYGRCSADFPFPIGEMQMNAGARVFVAGHRGMVGSAIIRALQARRYGEILFQGRAGLDLTDQAATRSFFSRERPDEVYIAAARVGGIHANSAYPAEFIYENLMIEANVIDAAFRSGVRKLLFLGSSCIYPRQAPQPIAEEQLLTGPLEATNEPYAIAKIAGIKLCESFNRQYGSSHGIDYRSVMPTNLYGPGDSYHPENSHVIPALIRRFHEAKAARLPSIVVWGSGKPRREFLHVDDLAEACLLVMAADHAAYSDLTAPMRSFLNVGYGSDVTIAEIAGLIARTVGYQGKVVFDTSRPDGTPRKLLDCHRISTLGWKPRIPLAEGLASAYQDFLSAASIRFA